MLVGTGVHDGPKYRSFYRHRGRTQFAPTEEAHEAPSGRGLSPQVTGGECEMERGCNLGGFAGSLSRFATAPSRREP